MNILFIHIFFVGFVVYEIPTVYAIWHSQYSDSFPYTYNL